MIGKNSLCTDEGLSEINEKDCKQAAEQRGLDFNTEKKYNFPAFCYKHATNSVYFNRIGYDVQGNIYGQPEFRSAPICRYGGRI